MLYIQCKFLVYIPVQYVMETYVNTTFWMCLSATSPNAAGSELEQARPQTSGEEELQLQLALAMSREAADQVHVCTRTQTHTHTNTTKQESSLVISFRFWVAVIEIYMDRNQLIRIFHIYWRDHECSMKSEI